MAALVGLRTLGLVALLASCRVVVCAEMTAVAAALAVLAVSVVLRGVLVSVTGVVVVASLVRGCVDCP